MKAKKSELFLIQSRADKDPKSKVKSEFIDDYNVSNEFFLSLNSNGESEIVEQKPDSVLIKNKHEQSRLFFIASLYEAIERHQKEINPVKWYAEFLNSIRGTSVGISRYQSVNLEEFTTPYRKSAGDEFSWETEFEYLHRHGLVLYYRHKLPTRVWLNPAALASYIHKKILSKKFILTQKGIISESKFNFNRDIIDLLKIQKIVFLHTHNLAGYEYIIPNYLQLAEEDKDFKLLSFDVQVPIFILKFENFIPFGLINQMICFYGDMPFPKRFWRDQLIFIFNEKRILIKIDFDSIEISIHSTGDLDLMEKQYLYYSIMALYWSWEPVGFKRFGELIRIDNNISRESIVLEKENYEEEHSQLKRIFEKAPSDLYVSSNNEDFVGLNSFYGKIQEKPNASKIIAYPAEMVAQRPISKKPDTEKSDITAPPPVREIIKKGGKEISISFLEPFTLKNLFSRKKVFISYAHDDIEYRLQVQKFLINLEREKLIEIWHDGMINPGDEWDDKIQDNLKKADIVILLVSQSFINSTYIFESEIKKIFERSESKKNNVIPVLLKNCDFENWKIYPPDVDIQKLEEQKYKLGNFQFLPIDDEKRLKPMVKWQNQEDAWMQLVTEMHKIIRF